MATWIVTIKEPRNPFHNPERKQVNPCKVAELCTDSLGQHHSLIVVADNEIEAEAKARTRFLHITRIEAAHVLE